MAAPQKYSHIDFTPPAGARKQAEQGLALRREHGRGGTAVGIARARDIANGVNLSPSTVRRMKAFFDRHASDSKAEGFRRGEKGYPSNGKIADLLWGGPAGYAWAKKVVAQMEAADERSTYSLDAETSTIGSGTDRRSSVIPNVERRFLGNFSDAEASDPDLLKVEERADPNTGKKQTYLVGYAATFGKNSLLLGDFVERIAPTAFEIVEKRKDGDGKPLETRCLFNHSPDNLLGRFPTTMKMWVDERGLRYECLLPESRKDLAELVARQDLKGSSFSFVVAEGGERWSSEEGRSIRTVTKIKSLLDCGPVTYPAYDSATVAVAKRSYDQFVASKPPKKKRDEAVTARAREVMEKTGAFLAERRGFCPTGPGGGVDNSCGKGGAGGKSAAKAKKEKSKKTKDDETDPNEPTIAGTAALGSAIGAGVGAAAGLPGAAVGALAGAAVGAATGAVSKVAYKAKTAVNKKISKLQQGKNKPDKEVDPNEPTILGSTALGAGIGTAFGAIGGPVGAAAGAAVGAGLGAITGAVDKVGYKINTGINKKISKTQKAIGEKVFGKKKRSLGDFMSEIEQFLAERRAFCPTGPGGGVKNDCGSKDGGGSVDPNDAPKTLEQQRIEAAGKSGFVTAPKASDKPKSLEQQRLEAAGEWDDRIDLPALADYDGGDNGGFVPDYHRDVTIPGTNQKVKINVDDPEHVKQFVELSAKASGVSVEEFMKANRFGGTLQKVTEHDKVKLFGGNWKQYRPKLARSGGWGDKKLDETAKRIGSTLRAGRIKGETLAEAVREYAKATGRDPKNEMYSGMKTYQRDPREFMQWARKRLDHYFASGKGKWGARSADGDESVESRIGTLGEFLHSRGFCPTGPGGGVDNSCGGGKDKGDDGPSGGIAGGKKSGDYKEWKKGDHLDKSKEKDAQDFLDKARKDQLARGGKDGGKSDDGGGVQTWSKGDHFPWTTKQVGTDKGHVQGTHPDGSKTAKYPFDGDSSEAHKKVYEEIASKKKSKRSSTTLAEMTSFFMERAR